MTGQGSKAMDQIKHASAINPALDLNKEYRTLQNHRVRGLRFSHTNRHHGNITASIRKVIVGEVYIREFEHNQPTWVRQEWEADGRHQTLPVLTLQVYKPEPVLNPQLF